MTFDEIRRDIELIFEQYRKHKYYTLFIDTVNVSVTSSIDEIGGGRSNEISDKVGNAAIKLADEKMEARRIVELVEKAVDQLPDVERQLIRLRYMNKNHHYINDYTVYELKMNPPMSDKTYRKVRNRALKRMHKMLVPEISLNVP